MKRSRTTKADDLCVVDALKLYKRIHDAGITNVEIGKVIGMSRGYFYSKRVRKDMVIKVCTLLDIDKDEVVIKDEITEARDEKEKIYKQLEASVQELYAQIEAIKNVLKEVKTL